MLEEARLFLLGCGLFMLGNNRYVQPHKNLIKKANLEAPVNFFISIIAYCITSNILLMTGLLFKRVYKDFNSQVSVDTIVLITGIISCVGIFGLITGAAVGIIRLAGGCKYRFAKMFCNFIYKQMGTRGSTYTIAVCCIAFACILYYVCGSKTPPDRFVYDTGLYHLPFVNHIGKFGMQEGLASLDMRYGFYNLNLYGQIALQAAHVDKYTISPSLNILIIACLFYFFSLHIVDQFKRKNIPKSSQDKGLNHILMYGIICISFTIPWLTESTISYSLASFNADIFIYAGSIMTYYYCANWERYQDCKTKIIFLIFCMPIIKVSGALFSIMMLICLSIKSLDFTRGTRLKIKSSWIKPVSLVKYVLSKSRNYRSSLLLLSIAICYLAVVSTNLLTTGYMFYPSNIFGQILSQGLSQAKMLTYSKETILNWARFPGGNYYLGGEKSWLQAFIVSDRGQGIVLFWIVPSIASLILAIVKAKVNTLSIKNIPVNDSVSKQSYSNRLFVLAASMTFTIAIAILYLPPDRRFYLWITPISVYIFYLVIVPFTSTNSKFYWLYGVLLAAVGLPGLVWQLKDLKNDSVKVFVKYRKPYIPAVRRKLMISKWGYKNNWKDAISQPIVNNQCWTTKPPCSHEQEHFTK